MDMSRIPSGSGPGLEELTALKFVKHGIAIEDKLHQALVEAGLIMRQLWWWTLSERGEFWDEVGYDYLRDRSSVARYLSMR